MLRIVPLGVFRNGFDLVGDGGQVTASFRGSVWRESGDILVAGQQYVFRREGRRRFRLGGPQGEVAVATCARRWSRGPWQIEVDARQYDLARASWLSRTYRLRLAGRPVGEVTGGRWGSHRGTVDLPAGLPAPAQAFIVAIVITLWRRAEASAASSG